MRYREVLPITIDLDRRARQPLARQIAEQVTQAVAAGRVACDTRLPSTRTLAQVLGVSRGITMAAYDLLLQGGVIEGRRGSGTYVSSPRPPDTPLPSSEAGLVDLRPDQVCLEAIPIAAWRSAWRNATFRHPPANPGPSAGLPELRQAIKVHLRRARGLALDRHEVIVTGGSAQALRLVLDVLGGRVAAPQWLQPDVGAVVDAYRAVRIGHHDPVPPSCRTAVVSPDNSPLVDRPLSANGRVGLARWCRDSDGYLVELGSDAVYRADVALLPTLIGMAPDHVVLVGGFGDLFGTAIGVGYAIVPKSLAPRFERRHDPPAYVPQRAMTLMLGNGSVSRVLHRLASAYGSKRRLARIALAALKSPWRAGEFDAMGRVVIRTSAASDAGRSVGYLVERGFLVSTLDDFGDAGREAGIVIGFGHLPDSTLERQLGMLVAAINANGAP